MSRGVDNPVALSIDDLYAAWRRAADYADLVVSNGWLDGREDVSDFWREYLDVRRPYPSFGEALVLRRGATWPLAERGADAADPAVERPWADSAWFVASREVPGDFLASIDESSLGAPVTFEFDGRQYSAGFLTNALTSWRIVDWVRRRGLERPLRILEIGAGYGQVALQLHQVLPIELYAVCDLPENLFLGSYYLQANLPTVAAAFVGSDSPPPVRGLAFTIPPFIEGLGGQWDVIVNTYSFQEMTLASVQAYFDFARANLVPDGFFYSLNSHGKQGAGVARPSDYPTDRFELLGLTPVRQYAFQALATHPYELVLAPGNGTEDLSTALDAVGHSLQFGLQLELASLMGRVSEQAMTSDDVAWVSAAAALFTAEDRAEAASRLNDAAPEATAFLRGALAFASGQDATAEFERIVQAGGGSHATALALTALGRTEEAVAVVPFLGAELTALSAHPRWLAAHFGRLLGFPNDALPRRLPRRLATMSGALGIERLGSRLTRSP